MNHLPYFSHTDGTKAIAGTNAGIFAQIKAVATKQHYSHYILPHHHTFTILKKKKKPVSINNFFFLSLREREHK